MRRLSSVVCPASASKLRYALDGELRSSQVHRNVATLAADAEGKRSEMEAKGWVAA